MQAVLLTNAITSEVDLNADDLDKDDDVDDRDQMQKSAIGCERAWVVQPACARMCSGLRSRGGVGGPAVG